jgi:leucyl-tRNA synthetase
VDYWAPIDLYVGGAEHAVMHLLYFRFFTMVLNDAGLVNFREPTPRLRNQGQMHAPDGQRMSKSRGNVITPDSVIADYSADALRGYLMFMGPFDADADWDETGINGIWRWLNRVWDLAVVESAAAPSAAEDDVVKRTLHKTIKKVTQDLEGFRFNTAISALMELTNLLQKERSHLIGTEQWRESIETLLSMMAPLTPYITEELWHRRGNEESIHRQAWPGFDPDLAIESVVKVVVQVNGRLRDTIEMPKGTAQESVEEAAVATETVQRYLSGKEVVKVVFVPDRLINFVVR